MICIILSEKEDFQCLTQSWLQALRDASPLVFIAGRFTVAGILLFLTLGWRKLNLRCLGPAAVFWFMNERLGARILIGAALILAGMIVSEAWGGRET